MDKTIANAARETSLYTEPIAAEKLFSNYADVVTVGEMAEMLRIGRNSAYDLVNNGYIKSVKVGNQIRIPKSSVIKFLMCS